MNTKIFSPCTKGLCLIIILVLTLTACHTKKTVSENIQQTESVHRQSDTVSNSSFFESLLNNISVAIDSLEIIPVTNPGNYGFYPSILDTFPYGTNIVPSNAGIRIKGLSASGQTSSMKALNNSLSQSADSLLTTAKTEVKTKTMKSASGFSYIVAIALLLVFVIVLYFVFYKKFIVK